MKSRQMSESIIKGLIMAFSGGFMDAYTYVFRDKVFANAQTGNIILFGLNLSSGDFSKAVEHLFPILAFTAGIFTAQLFRMHFKKRPHFHWRQLSLIAEIMIIIAVSFMPQSLNITANSLISFACGIQVQTIRKIRGNAIATTMCTGNLRTASDLLCSYLHSKNGDDLKKGLFYCVTIAVFMLGAVAGKIITDIWGMTAILASALLILACFIIMFIDEKELEG